MSTKGGMHGGLRVVFRMQSALHPATICRRIEAGKEIKSRNCRGLGKGTGDEDKEGGDWGACVQSKEIITIKMIFMIFGCRLSTVKSCLLTPLHGVDATTHSININSQSDAIALIIPLQWVTQRIMQRRSRQKWGENQL
mmetsp:Transcript_35700/g.65441  ORF Transcript_35700/g.65441 Transcript_35700/m.65441 type:complete len:139 (+) Transcript_35700:137-553(+)